MKLHARCKQPNHERGVALAISLVFLLVLTIIGVTALQTSTFEEGMARNTQEIVRAFSFAETGVSRAIATIDEFTTNDAHDNNEVIDTLTQGKVKYSRKFMGDTPPKRTVNTAQGSGTRFMHFEIKSHGRTTLNGNTVVDQGGYFEAPNPDDVNFIQ